MNSTKDGLYIVDLGSDDGSRLTVDGTLLYNNWLDQSFSSRPRVLMSLNGASSLDYEFYENGGQNRVVFQNLTLILANTLTTNTTQSICLGNTGVAISGDVYGTLPAGITLSGTGYQWTYSTTPLGTRTAISGATSAIFTPNTSVTPFNTSGTYYIFRNAVLSSVNNVSPNPYVATNVSNAATVNVYILPVATFSYSGSPYCSNGSNPSPTFSGGGVAGTFSSTAGLVFVSTATGQVNLTASTAGTYTITNTIAASGGCGLVTATSSITINPNLPVSLSIAPSSNSVCQGTSVIFTATPINGGASPAYQWKVNSTSVGTNSSTYTYAPANNDVVTCVLTSNANCATGSPATSNAVTLSVSATGTWLGITSTNWHTASNWCGGIPTATTDVTIPSGGNQPVISATAVCNNITINSGATLTIAGSNTLTVSGSWTKSGTFTPNLSTVNFNSSLVSNISASNFNNITISGAGTKNATGTIMAAGSFNLTAGQFNLNNSTSNNITISGNYTQTGGVFDFNTGILGACTMFIGGNMSNTAGAGSMTTSGGGASNAVIVFNGSGIQTLSIAVPGGAIWVKYSVPSGKSVQLLSNITLNSANGASQAVFQGEILVDGTFDLGTSTVTQNNGAPGTAVFTINSGATLITANTGGIDGSIASTNMTRTFSSGANYKFNGVASQVTSVGLPTTLNNLTIDNSAGVSLTSPVIINGSLAITTGAFSTGSNTLIFQNSNAPIIRTSGTITTTENTNIVFGTSGNTGGAAFAIPSGCFTSAPQINNLTINRINSLTLNNQMLSVKGILLCNGPLNTNNNLTLLSTSVQTALIDGSGTGDVTGNVSMQRYLASGFGYKYFSSPFQNATVSQFSSYVNLSASFPTFYSYNENLLTTGWVNYTNTAGNLVPVRGYAVNFGTAPAAVTVSLIGAVNNNILSPLTLTNNNKPYTKGFNLIGNPYPSPIDWDDASGWTKTNVDNAVYFFNAGNNGANGLANDSLQYQGTYSSYVNGIPTGNATNIIPSMQGFFVHVTDGTFPVSATLSVTNSVRTNDLNPSFKSMELNTRPLIRLGAGFAENGLPSDPAVIYFDDSSTLSFDTNLDALKLMNTDARVPSLYAMTPDAKRVSISGMPFPTDSVTWVPLGLKIEIQGWVTFNASDIEQLPAGMHVYLVDAVTHITQDLNINPLYRLLLKAGVYENRFSLVFSLSERIPTPIAVVSETFTITHTTGILVINPNLPAGEKGILQMVNMMGQVLYRKEIFGNEAIELNSRLSSGVYVISMISGNKIYSKKIIIQKG